MPRAARPFARWEVGAAEERLPIGRQPDAHRPAARLIERLHGGHVDRVDVGPLFAVDLDADVVAVHEGGDLFVLERLGLHHVAPVAGGVADRQEDRPSQAPRLLERLVPPGAPVDRVVRVLQEVGARFEDQPVGVLRRVAAQQVMRAGAIAARRGLTPAECQSQLRRKLGRVDRRFRRRGDGAHDPKLAPSRPGTREPFDVGATGMPPTTETMFRDPAPLDWHRAAPEVVTSVIVSYDHAHARATREEVTHDDAGDR